MDPLAPKIDIDFYGLTDVGIVRKQNEDQILIADLQAERTAANRYFDTWRLGAKGFLFVVCDGMGGAAAGEVASQLAVETVFAELKSLEPGLNPQDYGKQIDLAIQKANHKIHSIAKEDSTKKGMGTTISVAMVYGNLLFLGQIGDSRAYLNRNEKLYQVTKDQSLLEQLIERGEISQEHAASFTGRNVILQALGPKPEVLVDLKFLELRQDDLIILCSDGLHGVVEDQRIEEVLQKTTMLEQGAHVLLNDVYEGGAPDNVSIILFQVKGEDLQPPQENEPATPKHLKYARVPSDRYTEKMERELGSLHKVNKLFTSPVFLVLFFLCLFGGLGFFFVSSKETIGRFFQSVSSSQQQKQKGVLYISSDVQEATVYLNNKQAGKLEAGSLKLPIHIGTYKVHLSHEDWTSPPKQTTLKWGQETLLEFFRGGKGKPTSRKEWLPGK